MRGAEDTGPSSHTGAIDADNHGGRGSGRGNGRGDNDDALLQALSPRSLLASPRVVRRLSGTAGNPKDNAASDTSGFKGGEQSVANAGTSGGRGTNEDATTAARTGGRKVGIDRSYNEEQVYLLMQQVKSQQAKILELEEKAHPNLPRSVDRRRDRATAQLALSPSRDQRKSSEVQPEVQPVAMAPSPQAPPPQAPPPQAPPPQAPPPQAPPRGASDGSGANALLSQMDDTLGRIKAESHDNIRRAESQHALKLEGVRGRHSRPS